MPPPSVAQGLILVAVTVVNAMPGRHVNRGKHGLSPTFQFDDRPERDRVVGGRGQPFSTTITEALYHCTLCAARPSRARTNSPASATLEVSGPVRWSRTARECLGRLRRERATLRYILTILALSLLSRPGLGCESLPTRGNAISMPVRHGIPLLLSALVLSFPRNHARFATSATEW
jgi:hypothetical protein